MDLSGSRGELTIPMHTSSSYAGGVHGSLLHEHHSSSNGPPPPQHGPAEESKKRINAGVGIGIGIGGLAGSSATAVKYRECLKNHAAGIGGNATDGCGEFMPSGEEGSLEALKCSACGCHRNFHRKEVDGETAPPCDCSHLKGRRVMYQKGLLVAPPPPQPDPFGFPGARALPPPHAQHHMIMPLSAMQTSESDEMDAVGGGGIRQPMAKKRFRTKFTPEQKEKMLAFAEKVGWRLQKLEDGVVQQFCQEIGVKRRVLKVWMHNNKHSLAKKTTTSPLQLDQ